MQGTVCLSRDESQNRQDECEIKTTTIETGPIYTDEGDSGVIKKWLKEMADECHIEYWDKPPDETTEPPSLDEGDYRYSLVGKRVELYTPEPSQWMAGYPGKAETAVVYGISCRNDHCVLIVFDDDNSFGAQDLSLIHI